MSCYVKAIIPIEIKGSQITATNITDTSEYSAYSSGQTLPKGQIRTHAGRHMWSQIDPNVGNTPVLKISDNCDWALVEGGLPYTFSASVYTDIADWVAGSYSVGDRRIDKGYIFECVTATTERPPFLSVDELKPLKETPWIFHSPSNALASFDYSPSTITSNDNTITYTVEPDNFTHLSFINADANSIRVRVLDKDNNDIEVFNELQKLFLGSYSFWEYCFKDRADKRDVVFNVGLSHIKHKKVEITIDNTGKKATFGAWVWGFEVSLGVATRLQLNDKSFSDVIKNKFRLTSIREGAEVNTLAIPMDLKGDEVDEVRDRMSAIKGKPVLVIATENFRMSLLYGLSLEYELIVEHANLARVRYRIEELK